MSEQGGVEGRLRRLEQQGAEPRDDVDAARRDAAAARVLAVGADRDVSDVRVELRAHRTALNALRDGQRELWEGQRELRDEMRAGFAAIEGRFAVMASNFAVVTNNFAQVESKFAVVNSGLRQIITLLDDRPGGS
jgi:hypothetical protein